MIQTARRTSPRGEVEEVLYTHPAVAEVAVSALPDEKWIERVCAVVVVRDGEPTTDLPATLLAHARERMAGFKAPKQFELIDALPKNPSGKILKRQLRETHST